MAMSADASWRVYAGNGTTIDDRGARLPEVIDPRQRERAEGYRAPDALADAVNVALALGQPLLVTGDPGTGKTQLAHSIAHELRLGVPLVFNTKTTSTARDLFYRYDALRHFHDAQFRRMEGGGASQISARDYIEFTALGLAILRVADPERARPFLPRELLEVESDRTVVLIDEIDKAPRDLPNDVLNEIEGMTFEVKETGERFAAPAERRPIVVFTSNSEKNLPEAFLRRCVFFHLEFPKGRRLEDIVVSRLGPEVRPNGEMVAWVRSALSHFETIRGLGLTRKPATAELLAWLEVLRAREIDLAAMSPGEADAVAFTYSILAKSENDLKAMLGLPLPTDAGR